MRWVAITAVLLLALVMLLPMLLLFANSVKGYDEQRGAPGRVIPRRPTLENFRLIFTYPFGRWFLNSTIIVLGSTAGTMAVSLMAAFGISKYRFRGKNLTFATIVLGILLPGQVTFVASFVVLRTLGLYNTLWAFLIPGFDAGAIWFAVKYMGNAITEDHMAMAELDGLGAYGKFWHVGLSLARPAIAALLAIRLVAAWGNYLMPLVLLRDKEKFTMPLGVREVMFVDALIKNDVGNPGIAMAGAVLTILPGLILFLVFQKYFISGLVNKPGG